VAVTGPDGAVSRAEFDAAGRVRALKPALGLPVALKYDAAGRPLSAERRGAVETTRHDGVGRVVERRSAAGRVLTTAYGLDDMATRHVDHRGVHWEYTRDANDALVEHTYDHITERYTRDAAGEVVVVRAADGGERRYTPAWGRNKKEAEQRAASNALGELRAVGVGIADAGRRG
jgi:YD repeat-containing protein